MSLADEQEIQVEALDEEYTVFGADIDTICTICNAEFLDAEDLTIHLQQVHKVSDHDSKQCQFCSSTYSDLIEYAKHLRDNHILNLRYCEFCLRAFSDENDHKLHEKKHGNKVLINCTQCTKKFTNLLQLRTHDVEDHSNNIDGIIIQKYLPYLSAVLNVKAVTFLLSLRMDDFNICNTCSYSTVDVNFFIQHAKLNKCTSFVCGKCSNVYKKKYYLVRHMLKDCDVPPKCNRAKMCPECHTVFSIHMFAEHKKNCKIIKCYTCGKHYESMYQLSEHQSKEHPLSVELKTCTFCWKQCVGNVALQKHVDRSHKPELHLYKYHCVYCKSAFKHPQKLFGHFFSKHKDIDPYTCKICDKKFHLRKKFTLHIKLDHKSVGFVEFDKNYHVFFAEKKSDNPFIPKSIYKKSTEEQKENQSDATPDKQEESSKNDLLNTYSGMSATETEGNQTEVESAPKSKLKCKRILKVHKEDPITLQSSDDEPLLIVKKRTQKNKPKIFRNKWIKKLSTKINKTRFICNICNKNCYTYQNYNHHKTLHSNKDDKKCIKCFKVFRSKEKLNNHIATDHSTSKLTETLRNLLEKRKNGQSITDDLPMAEKFRRTIKKAETSVSLTTATITSVENKLSVKKFIENFTPEVENKYEAVEDNSLTIKCVTGIYKEPTIKMTKFKSKPIPTTLKLAMPVKFKECYSEKCVASIRLVQQTSLIQENSNDHDYHHFDDDSMDRNESIPEVAEEVMLEETVETPKVVKMPHKLVIPELPAGYKDIRIAHMLPQAPFYKIVKVNDVLNKKVEKKEEFTNSATINLPDGTRLVNTNPLAHLLGKTPIEKVLGTSKNKYYKPKIQNFQGMLVDALNKLDKPVIKKKKKVQEKMNEQETEEKVEDLPELAATEEVSTSLEIIE